MPNTREKLIELLETLFCSATALDIADYLIAQGVTIQKWIPVTERLPEEDEGVVLIYSGGVEPAVISGDIFLEYDKYEGWTIDDVTHWMPLPEPPKGD